jgi:adenylosuccinate synthase
MNSMFEKIVEIFRKFKTVGVTCLQWGDTGKGKIIDILAELADIIARGTGGSNAGHSVWINGVLYILHLVPCGILRDREGKTNVIGNGVAVDPKRLCEEIALLQSKGIACNNLMVAVNAKLTLPTQIVRDSVGEDASGKAKIGTTKRGIGPTYSDHALRIGLFVNDLLNPDILAAKVRENVAYSVRLLKSFDPEAVKKALHDKDLCNGIFYHPEKMFDVDAIVQQYLEYGRILEPFIRDTDTFIQENVGKKNLLLEGANGTLLDVDYGTYPYGTSTGCNIDCLAKGVGLNRAHVGMSYGIFKGFYETRVGEGPFPTEFGGDDSAIWCGTRGITKEVEKEKYPGVSVNDKDEFRKGVAFRFAGDEYGATTGRPRRTGWFDVPLFRHSLRWGSMDVVATKLDVLDDCDEIRICTQYTYMGPRYRYGDRTLNPGDHLQMAIPIAEVLKHCRPVYRTYPGWKSSLKGITSSDDLPGNLKNILGAIILETGVCPRILSTGSNREATIFL